MWEFVGQSCLLRRSRSWSSICCAMILLIALSARAQSVSMGPLSLTPDPQTGYFLQTVTIGNPTGADFPGVHVLVRDLPPDTQETNKVRVGNAHGVVNIGASTNIPFFDFGPIAAGASIDFQVDFYISNRKIFPTPRYEVTVQAPPIKVIPTSLLVTNNATRIVDGKFYAEFKTEEGRAYYVQYNTSISNTSGWKTSLPNIRGTGGRILWVDEGPPRTESKPTTIGSRFYRVIVLP